MTEVMEAPQALIFDVFGTCVDWRFGITREVAAAYQLKRTPVDGPAVADAWRGEYQPAMEAIRSGGRGYVALDDLHRETLLRVQTRMGQAGRFSDADRAALARAWEKLPPWPDVVPGLTRLKRDYVIAPCSNGSIALMTHLARYGGLPWDCILGADIARDYKPKPRVYQASAEALRLRPDQVMMVACHEDDLAAARAAGLMTAYVPRPTEWGPPRDVAPTGDWDLIAQDFEVLAEALGA